mgnify:CR=1 FL=1
MRVIEVFRRFGFEGVVSGRCGFVMKMFGLDADSVAERQRGHKVRFKIAEGDIVFITGPSGGGKSVVLNEIYKQFAGDEKISLNEIGIDEKRAVADCFEGGIVETLGILAKAGISDAFSLLKKPGCLSEGQKYRFRLAKALASGKKVIFADEFCSNLDRLTAAVVAYKTARFARKEGLTLVLASSHEDLLEDMGPDVVIVKHAAAEAEVVYKDRMRENAKIKN